jgi:catechol 2,3-dioxygenase-like lactoylglutathione lyase family enzyme
VRQVGIVVRDLARTARHYQTMFGIGPWHRPRTTGDTEVQLRGRPIDSRFDIAIAYSGGVQLELIEPRGGQPSIYDEHLREHGEGIHHLGYCVRSVAHRLERVRALGIEVLQSGTIRTRIGAVTHFAYLDTREVGGVILELIETRLSGLYTGMSRPVVAMGRLLGNFERV